MAAKMVHHIEESDDAIIFGPGGYDFAAPCPLPKAAQDRVAELCQSGMLFRYQERANDVAMLEHRFSEYIGLPFTVGCNSGGCGLFLALKALGASPGVKVLVNAWTLAPVPGAVVHAGATPVFVRSDPDTLVINLDDLEKKAEQSGAKILVLSYMRGHVPDMDRVMASVRRLGLTVIEDCAHTLGAKWRLDGDDAHRHLGSFGVVGVWSLQTNKSINCGEGGLISTAHQDIASFITVATGSYGHFAMNGASGDVEKLEHIYPSVPNMSMRMTTIAAALALPQLSTLEDKLVDFARNASIIRRALEACPHVQIVKKHYSEIRKEVIVWSSIQFRFLDFTPAMIQVVVSTLGQRGIPLAWFGGEWKGFTSTLKDWKFAGPLGGHWEEEHAATTSSLVDFPLYHTSTWRVAVIERAAELLIEVIESTAAGREGAGKHAQVSVTGSGSVATIASAL